MNNISERFINHCTNIDGCEVCPYSIGTGGSFEKCSMNFAYQNALDDYYNEFYRMLHEQQQRYEKDKENYPKPSAMSCLALMVTLNDKLKYEVKFN